MEGRWRRDCLSALRHPLASKRRRTAARPGRVGLRWGGGGFNPSRNRSPNRAKARLERLLSNQPDYTPAQKLLATIR